MMHKLVKFKIQYHSNTNCWYCGSGRVIFEIEKKKNQMVFLSVYLVEKMQQKRILKKWKTRKKKKKKNRSATIHSSIKCINCGIIWMQHSVFHKHTHILSHSYNFTAEKTHSFLYLRFHFTGRWRKRHTKTKGLGLVVLSKFENKVKHQTSSSSSSSSGILQLWFFLLLLLFVLFCRLLIYLQWYATHAHSPQSTYVSLNG